MKITTKRPVQFGVDKATGKPITVDAAKKIRDAEKEAGHGKPPKLDDSAVELREEGALHVYMSFASDPRTPDGWHLSLTMCPGTADPNGGERVDMQIRRSRSYTSRTAPTAVQALAAEVQAALQRMIDAQEE